MATTTYNTGFTDAESVNNSPRSTFLYKDLNLYFTPNPVTKDISTVTDIQDIKRSVRNLVLLNPGEKPFHPEIGTGIREAMFENYTPHILALLRKKIAEVIKRYEPRVALQDVDFSDSEGQRIDNNELRCIIRFRIRNAPEVLQEVNLMLQRLR